MIIIFVLKVFFDKFIICDRIHDKCNSMFVLLMFEMFSALRNIYVIYEVINKIHCCKLWTRLINMSRKIDSPIC